MSNRPTFVGVMDLSAEEYIHLTLHDINSKSQTLRGIAREWGMGPNSSLLVVNRCRYKRRFREVYMDHDGVMYVKLCEHDDRNLSIELAASELYHRRLREHQDKALLKENIKRVERRIEWHKRREAKKRRRKK